MNSVATPQLHVLTERAANGAQRAEKKENYTVALIYICAITD